MRPDRHRLLAACVLIAVTAGPAAPARGAHQPPAASTARALRGAGDARRGGSMPDSVLAFIGSRREVSLAVFQEAWRQVAPPARPDSLTPQGARRFLELLAGKEALGEVALATPHVWSAEDSARYEGLRDQLTLAVVLDSALAATRAAMAAAGDTSSSVQVVGVVARDSTVARMRPVWDEPALERMAAAFRALPKPSRDSGLMANLRVLGMSPQVGAGDRSRVLAAAADGPFRVVDLIEAWRRLNPLERPRIETAEQVRDLVRNGMFERRLRADARARGIERRPDIAAALARQREFIAVQHLVAREVYARIARDSVTLRRWYDRDPGLYTLPTRVRVLRFELDSRAGATGLALRLRDPAEADSIAARGRRGGAEYEQDLTAARDSALFARALGAGAGAVLGPDSVAGGWRVVRVGAVLPPRPRPFGEVGPLVDHDWYGREGERLMEDLLARCRERIGVRVNEAALRRLTAP